MAIIAIMIRMVPAGIKTAAIIAEASATSTDEEAGDCMGAAVVTAI